MALEHAARWWAEPSYRLPDLDGPCGMAVVAEPGQALEAWYYDTTDRRLLSVGVTLCLRAGEGTGRWTLRLPAAGRLLARREIDFAGDADRPPEAARLAVRVLLRGQRLRRRWRIRTVRTLYRLVTAPSGAFLADLCDDRVRASGPGLALRQFRELELRLGPAAGAALLRRVGRALEAAGARRADPGPGLARALAGDAPATGASAAAPGARSAASCLAEAVAAATRRLVASDPAIRLDLDPEAVHEARVAVRQLRSQLKTFGALLDPAWRAEVRAGLLWLAAALGRVRDLDVLSLWLEEKGPLLAAADHPRLARLNGALAAQRALALSRLRHALDSARYRRLVARLAAAADGLPSRSDREPDGRDSDLARLLGRPWRRLRKTVKRLAAPATVAELHRVRILAKHARYAFEAAIPGAGRPAGRLAAALARLQDDLGEVQDAAWAEAWLRRTALTEPATRVVVGTLVALRRADAAAACKGWPEAWRRARRAARRLRAAGRLD